ncbi:2-hydroxy-palmitic acid dioxygenase mpo1-like [Vicia villosa]|uniref:2-hydroxy-palmitic acid dioxygenase mpo1-like n=1 Tax=Vicia villosa TaxID=3911 RepID=UPI00273AB881|nr:2-hydroxy-palmitic acid dioxygenase mpo1-like [Vicia villosa]
MGLLDLEKHFAFYGSYHSNPINIIIHIIFVWPILFTTLILLYFTPPIFSPSQTLLNLIPHVLIFNIGFFFTVFYSLFYIALDFKAGSFVAVLTFLCWVSSSFVADSIGFELAWKIVLAAQLLCWTGQFIGHGVFEKRAPALLDNLAQAFLMAPFFVVLEILQTTIGYEPYPGFEANVKAKIDANIKEWKDKQQKKLS